VVGVVEDVGGGLVDGTARALVAGQALAGVEGHGGELLRRAADWSGMVLLLEVCLGSARFGCDCKSVVKLGGPDK